MVNTRFCRQHRSKTPLEGEHNWSRSPSHENSRRANDYGRSNYDPYHREQQQAHTDKDRAHSHRSPSPNHVWSFDDSDEFEFFNWNRDKLLEQNRKWFKEFSHKKTYREGSKRLEDEEDRISRKRRNQEDESRHDSSERCQKVKSHRDHSKSHRDEEEVKKARGGSKVGLDGAATPPWLPNCN